MKLSIIIPVFNEEKSVLAVVKKVQEVEIPKVEKEIIIVDDGSTDTTASELKKIKQKTKNVKVITHEKNQGKGAAVKTGIDNATGEYAVIQDADSEYNPQDIIKLFSPIIAKQAEVVYGSRLNRLPDFSKEEKQPLFILHYFGNRFLSLITSL